MIGRLFKLHSREKHADSLANYLPNSRIFSPAKFRSDAELRKVLLGLAGELARVEKNISDLYEERDIRTTTNLIEEWESAVGIPDEIFPGNGPLQERRDHVLIKFTMSVQTTTDFERLARIFGYTDVTVTPLAVRSYPPYSVPFYPQQLSESRFVAVVEGTNILQSVPPYDVPFDVAFGSSFIQTLFDKLKPANVKFIYENRAN